MKHHYIPAFYLRQWANGPKAELCEHKKVFRSIEPRRTSAEGTGYMPDLYKIEGVPPEQAHEFEQRFMKLVDTDAHRAMTEILAGASPSSRLRTAWSRFVLSLLFRNPEAVTVLKGRLLEMWGLALAGLENQYAAFRQPSDPNSFEEFVERTKPALPQIGASNFLEKIIDNNRVVPAVFSMHWTHIDLRESKIPLLTSDRPLEMPFGLGHKNAYIALPISPHSVFLAAYSDEPSNFLRNENPTKLVKGMNLLVVRQARKYVWGVDDAQLAFVRKHLGLTADREIFSEAQMEEAREYALGVGQEPVKLD